MVQLFGTMDDRDLIPLLVYTGVIIALILWTLKDGFKNRRKGSE